MGNTRQNPKKGKTRPSCAKYHAHTSPPNQQPKSLYPGTNVSRDAAALELLALLLSSSTPTTLTLPTYRRALAPLLASPSAVHSLLNLFLAPWERTRRQAFDLLVAFPPGPLPGIITRTAAGEGEGGSLCRYVRAYLGRKRGHTKLEGRAGQGQELELGPYLMTCPNTTAKQNSVDPAALHWATQLTLSARRGEAEAGALMLRLLFRRTHCGLTLSSFPSSSTSDDALLHDEEEEEGLAASLLCGRVRFLAGLRRLIAARLDGYERGLAAWGAGEGGAEIVMVFGPIQVRAQEEMYDRMNVCLDASWMEVLLEVLVALSHLI
jgi:hypothetical protein